MTIKLPKGERERKLFLTELRKAYESGVTIRGLAQVHFVTYSCMHRWLQLAGVEMRPRGGPHGGRRGQGKRPVLGLRSVK